MEKKLQRSQTDKWIAGVCGGLAEYYGIDVLLVRLIFFILAWVGFGGVLIYLILWFFVMPEGPTEDMPLE